MNLGAALSNESKFGRAMTKCGSVIAVNVMFVVTCIPFVTVGAGAAAMYHAVFEILKADASPLLPAVNPFRAYWEGLKKHFLRATLIWLALAGVAVLGWADLQVCAQAGGAFRFMSAGVIAVMLAAAVTALYLFPVMTQMSGKMTGLMKLSVFMAMQAPFKMLVILVLNCAMPLLMVLDEVNRPTYAFAGTFFSFGLSAWITGKLLLGQLSVI